MTKRILSGAKHDIEVWSENGKSPVVEFLETLRRNGVGDAEWFYAEFERMAAVGPVRNREKCKQLDQAKGIYELKSRGGYRILWFYSRMDHRVILCTHGFKKPKARGGYDPEIRRAQRVRGRYERELMGE